MCVSVCVPSGNPHRAGECGTVAASPLSGHCISHVKTQKQFKFVLLVKWDLKQGTYISL